MFFGCYSLIGETCKIEEKGEFGYIGQFYRYVKCKPWVAWVAGNAAFHFMWVSTLTICQIYQVRLTTFFFSKSAFSQFLKATQYKKLEPKALWLKLTKI